MSRKPSDRVLQNPRRTVRRQPTGILVPRGSFVRSADRSRGDTSEPSDKCMGKPETSGLTPTVRLSHAGNQRAHARRSPFGVQLPA